MSEQTMTRVELAQEIDRHINFALQQSQDPKRVFDAP